MRKLYIDGNNTFIRHYTVNPGLNVDGYPVGGIFGFLRDVGNLMHLSSPDEVVIVWDGEGGSVKKRKIMKEYKEGRKAVSGPKLNREYELDPGDEKLNRFFQMDKLKEYLDYTPIKQVELDGIEADDILAYLVQRDARKGHKCVIVSMDKDFLQLVDSNVVIYRPVKKDVYTVDKLVEDYGIRPRNFALYRSMLGKGDKSDNIKGIQGVGEKTFLKFFPMFSEDRDVNINEVVDFCRTNRKKSVKYERCVQGSNIITRNYRLSQLYSPMIGSDKVLELESQLDDNDGNFQHHNLIMLFRKDGFPFIDGLDKAFRYLKGIAKNY